MDALRDRSTVWPAAAAVGLLSLLLGAITLGQKSLWYDEAFNARRIKDSWWDLALIIRGTEMSQGVYMGGLKAWATVTPNSETWLRLPSVAFAALAAALLVPLGTRLFDRPTGIIAGVILATNAYLVRHAQEARTYALVTLAVVIASIFFVRALDDPRRRNWLLYAVAAAAAVYCHFYAGFVIVAHVATLPFAPVRPPWRRVIEAGALFVVLIAPTLYFTARAGRSQLNWIEDPSSRLVLRVVDTNTGQNLILAATAALGLMILTYRAGNGSIVDRWRLTLIGGWCAVPIALGIVVSQVQPILVVRYLIVIAPALALAAAFPVALALSRRRAAGVVALLALVAVSGYRLVDWYQRVPEDWRGAASYIASERQTRDAIVVAPFWAGDAYRYYEANARIDETAGARRTFVILYASSGLNPSELADARVDENILSVTGERRFGDRLYVRIYEPRE